MSKADKLFINKCDKCKKKFFGVILYEVFAGALYKHKYLLCNECMYELKKFLKN